MSWLDQEYCIHSWWFFRGKNRLFKYANRWLSCIKETSCEINVCRVSWWIFIFCCFILVLFFNVESIAGCPTTTPVYIAVHITHASLVCVFKKRCLDCSDTWKGGMRLNLQFVFCVPDGHLDSCCLLSMIGHGCGETGDQNLREHFYACCYDCCFSSYGTCSGSFSNAFFCVLSF